MIVTEIKKINVVNCTPEQPVFLRWLNSLGGFDSWLFSKSQQVDVDVTQGDNFHQVVNYLEEENTNVNVIKKNGNLLMTLGADNLTLQQLQGIRSILGSPKVYWLQGQPQTNDFIRLTVLVKTGTFKLYDTEDTRHRIEFQIISPNLYLQSN